MNKEIKLLVIDDEEGIRDLFKFILQPKGFAIETAKDGEEGLAMVTKNDYDLVFLDVHMPKMRGPEVLKAIKLIKPEQTVIVFSSSSDPEHTFENMAVSQGAYSCIYKPFTNDEIMKVIDKALTSNE